MNPSWITAIVATLGLAGNALWTTINLRIENRLLVHIDGLKDWARDNFEPRRTPAPPRHGRAQGEPA